jgi:hypothetical protein
MTVGTKTKTRKKIRTKTNDTVSAVGPKSVKRKAGTVKNKTVKKARSTSSAAKPKVGATVKSTTVGTEKGSGTVRKSRTKAVSSKTKKSPSKKKNVKTTLAKTSTRTKVSGGKVSRSVAKKASKKSIVAEEMLEQELKREDEAVQRQSFLEEKERDLLERLSVSMDRYDDIPNLELAASIVFHLDRDAVNILIGVIERRDEVHGPDSARVLAEVASRDAELIEPYLERLVALVHHDNWEMLPFVMCSLAPLGERVAEDLWDYRELLWAVIHEETYEADFAQAAAVKLLSAMCAAGPDYARTLAGGLVDLLGKCMPCNVAMYAEAVLPALGTAHSHRAKPVLDRRIKELMPAEVARLRRAVRSSQVNTSYFAAA